MPKYWVCIFRPEGYDASGEGEEMAREIDALNGAMVTAGVREFVGGLQPPATARAIHRADSSVSQGPLLATAAHPGGFWVLDVLGEDEALEWGRKAAAACRADVQVWPFH
jgi:hypothetical protein